MAVMELDRVAHPGAETLRKLAQGYLPADEVAALEEHLAECESCCRLMEETPEDSFVGRLRQARALPAVDTLHNTAALTLSNEDDEPGELADHPRYRLIRLLGRGGMGAVYLAEHRHMARPVALKVISPELVSQRGTLSRFQQEVRTAAKLDHPNIVAGYDADQAGSLHFLVMEYVEGQNLADYLREKSPLPVAQACDIIRQAAQGLQHAHERGMVHRDIKPHNLMLTPTGQVKVLDFGLARLAAEPAGAATQGQATPTPHLTGAGAVIGSADYIAPEQARDAHAADCRSDIYSLGCTLYHLLTNRPPFPEGTAPEKLHSHSADDPCCLTALRPEVPDELAGVIAKMMAKRPEDRYQSAAEVAAALAPFTVRVARKPRTFRARVLAVAALALVLSSLAAAGVVRISAGDREIVIETDDPTVEVVVKGDRIVRIADPKTGKAYQLDRNDLTLSLADDPDGLAVVLDGERPLNLKRQGKRIATVRLVEPAPVEPKPPVKQAATPPSNGADHRRVQVEVTVARVERAEARRLASRWIDVPKNMYGKQPPTPRDQTQPIFGIAQDRDGFLKDLSALKEKGLAKVVSEPRVMTESGRSTWLVSGGEAPMVTTSETGVTNVSYKMFGTIVNFLPTILADGKIQLEVRPEISQLDERMGINIDGPKPTSIPGFLVQRIQATVQMESGKTLVLGGLIEKGSKEGEEELIFLVTPHVIGPPPPKTSQQVQLDVICAAVARAEARQLTARWTDLSKLDGGSQSPSPPGQTRPKFGVLKDGGRIRDDLLALRDKGLAKLVADTRVVTLSGRPNCIVSGGETPILTTPGTEPPKVSYKTFGTIVSCLPMVLGNGKMHLEVRPEISNLNTAAGISLTSAAGTTTVPGFDIRTAQAAADLEEGQTLAIGGLMQTAISAQESKVPILGDIPLIGFFFSSETYTETEEEFIILVTPHVIDPAPLEPSSQTRPPEGHKHEKIPPPPPHIGN